MTDDRLQRRARTSHRLARLPGARALSRLHALIYRATGGRFIPRWFGAPVLVLEVVGRKTGLPRRNPVVYARHGDSFVVVAANGGVDRHPQWFLNLRDAGAAVVHVRRRRIPLRAEVVEGPDRDDLWKVFLGTYPDAEGYTAFTDRRFPIVRLDPLTEEQRH